MSQISLLNQIQPGRSAGRPAAGCRWWRGPLAFLLAATLLMPGCGGCVEDPHADDAKKEEQKDAKKIKKPKPDFEPPKLSILPQRDDLALRPVKPGHWTAATEEVKANNFDFHGALRASLWDSGNPAAANLERTPYRLAVTRPAALAKGQGKQLEFNFFVPGDRGRVSLLTELVGRAGNVAASPGPEPLIIMRPHQYKLVVLAAEPDRYRPLERLDSVRGPQDGTPLNYYQIIARPLNDVPLPTNPLTWTSIAYIFWDDVDPAALTSEQQQALLDWLHWGGQIVMSGPKSLDRLRGSFLAPYLPAAAGEAISIDAQRLEPLSRRWTLPENNQSGPPLAPSKPWSGVTLAPAADAVFLPDTADLVVERQVGRGRIVATAFRLAERDLWNWHSFDTFLNGVLLRRPARKYELSPNLGLSLNWADTSQAARDPHLVSRVRILSRDWKQDSAFDPPKIEPPADAAEAADPSAGGDPAAAHGPAAQPIGSYQAYPGMYGSDSYFEEITGPGVAGWTDFSEVSDTARNVLRDGAGIVVPKASFVMSVLVVYLIVLVPLNWLVFWGLGRVEWAWIAAPIIAIGGMAVVVKLAQLDIGFARSQTEVAILETFNGYPRGHLTRYTALYTSLSTTYDVESNDPHALVLPLSSDANFTPLAGQSYDTVLYEAGPQMRLKGFGVSSNSTGMLHTEQVLDLGGAIDYRATGDRVDFFNRTLHDLKQAAVLRRTADGKPQIAWLGDIAATRGTTGTFVRPDAFEKIIPNWNFRLDNSGGGPTIDLAALADLLRDFETIAAGEARLLALVDKPMDGIEISPASSQSPRGATLLVCHLQGPPPKPPTPDSNSRRDFPQAADEPLWDDPRLSDGEL